MIQKLLNLKERLLISYEYIRQSISTHPKMVIWRLKIFNLSPFVGKNIFKILSFTSAILFVYILMYTFYWRAPSPFPENILVTVEKGQSISEIAKIFEEKKVVRSDFWLKTIVIGLGGEKQSVAGDYYFPNSKNVWKVAQMLNKGEFGLIPFRTTIHEGLSSYQISDLLSKQLPSFDSKKFIDTVESEKLEGYLFPDTYFFMQNTKAEDVILMMRETFAREVKRYEEDILKFKKPMQDILIMASILEGEANTLESKRIISGILWKRLRIGMPLQVDAVFKYYNGKHSYTLTSSDLKDDHEYNTYTNKGLPPTPINNPGIDSIRAAITPTPSDYLYFLSDLQGNMYYSKTFDEHKAKKEIYIP